MFKKAVKTPFGTYESAQDFIGYYKSLNYRLVSMDYESATMATKLADGVLIVKWSRTNKKPIVLGLKNEDLQLLTGGDLFE